VDLHRLSSDSQLRISDSEQSIGSGENTAGRNGASRITPTHANGHNSSVSTHSPSTISLDLLSPRGQAIARQIGTRMVQGFSLTEIARELETSQRSISALVDELRGELEELQRPT
jgi:DNA-binding NarL/FixJ family response regulator